MCWLLDLFGAFVWHNETLDLKWVCNLCMGIQLSNLLMWCIINDCKIIKSSCKIINYLSLHDVVAYFKIYILLYYSNHKVFDFFIKKIWENIVLFSYIWRNTKIYRWKFKTKFLTNLWKIFSIFNKFDQLFTKNVKILKIFNISKFKKIDKKVES